MADMDSYHLKVAQDAMSKALEHEQAAEFSIIAADLIMDELKEHPEVKGTSTEREFLRRHKKHIAKAKWHASQIEKLEKKYNRHMQKVESASNKENN